jgi:VCBS repeat-containing protein
VTNEDTPLTIPVATGLLSNDSDVETSSLIAQVMTNPSHGKLTLNADGSFTYTPNANFNGADSFTYRASDGADVSTIATVTIGVTAVNDAPVAVNDSYSTSEDSPLGIGAGAGVLVNDSDIESGTLTAVLVTGPAHGTLKLNADGSFTYTPHANYNGTDSFTYQASDGTNLSNIATATITITAVNDAPTPNADSFSTDEDTALSGNVLANDVDVEGDAMTASLVSGPAHGSLTFNADGSFSYTPTANYNGPDSFTYRVGDGTATSAPTTASITVKPVNDAPVAVQDPTYTATNGGLLGGVLTAVASGNVLTNDRDVDGDTLKAELMPNSLTFSNGLPGLLRSFSLNQDGSFTFQSNVNLASFTVTYVYRAYDESNGVKTYSNPITVTISVPSSLGL